MFFVCKYYWNNEVYSWCSSSFICCLNTSFKTIRKHRYFTINVRFIWLVNNDCNIKCHFLHYSRSSIYTAHTLFSHSSNAYDLYEKILKLVRINMPLVSLSCSLVKLIPLGISSIVDQIKYFSSTIYLLRNITPSSAADESGEDFSFFLKKSLHFWQSAGWVCYVLLIHHLLIILTIEADSAVLSGLSEKVVIL